MDSSLQQFPYDWFFNYPSGYEYLEFGRGDLPAGERERGWVTFQVPDSTEHFLFSFAYQNQAFSVDLGSQPFSQEPPAELTQPNPNAHSLGEKVRQGNVELTVLGWNYGSGEIPHEGNIFLVVHLQAQNLGAVRQDGLNQTLILRDATGYFSRANYGFIVGDSNDVCHDPYDILNSNLILDSQCVFEARALSGDYVLQIPYGYFGLDSGDPVLFNLGKEPAEAGLASSRSGILAGGVSPLFQILGVLCGIVLIIGLIVALFVLFRRRRILQAAQHPSGSEKSPPR
jgi:hypothetical protein